MKLDLVYWPEVILSKQLSIVEANDPDVKEVINKLKANLVATNGLGLTACQIGVDKAVFVYWHEDKIEYMINPKILEVSESIEVKREGCLSMPGVFYRINRPKKVKVAYQDVENVFYQKEFEDLSARVIQHEIDHINGITLLDYMPNVLKKMALDKYYKHKRKMKL